MTKTAKVAITVDQLVLAAVEQLRRKTGESRSALVTRALRILVAQETHQARVEQYVAAYRAQPETAHEVAAGDRLAAEALAEVPWE